MNSKISIHQLAEGVAAEAHITSITAQLIIKELFELVASTLEAGEEFYIEGIGHFACTGIAANPIAFQPTEEFAKAVNAPFDMFEPQPLSAPLNELDAIDRMAIDGLQIKSPGNSGADIAVASPTTGNESSSYDNNENAADDNGPETAEMVVGSEVKTEETLPADESDWITDSPEVEMNTVSSASSLDERELTVEERSEVTDKDKTCPQPNIEEAADSNEKILQTETVEDSADNLSVNMTDSPDVSFVAATTTDDATEKSTECATTVQPPIFNPLPPFPEEVEEKGTNISTTLSAATVSISSEPSIHDNREEEVREHSDDKTGKGRSSSRFGIGFATGLIVGIAVGALTMFVLFLAMTRIESGTVTDTGGVEEIESAEATEAPPVIDSLQLQ